MTEGVDVVAHGGRDSQVVRQESLAIEKLPAHRLAGREVAVGLDPLPAGDHPTPGADKPADAGKQRGEVSMTQR